MARELKRRREVESAEDEEREKGRDGERRGGTPLSSGRGRKTPRKTPDKKVPPATATGHISQSLTINPEILAA